MKFSFAYLLPILVLAAILYEFYSLGFTVEGSVNKLLLGIVYGILLYIAAYIIKTVGMTAFNRLGVGGKSQAIQ